MARCWCAGRATGRTRRRRASNSSGARALPGRAACSDRRRGARSRQPGRVNGTEAGPRRRGLPPRWDRYGRSAGYRRQHPDARPAHRLPPPLSDRLLQRRPRHHAHHRPGTPPRDPGPGHRQRAPGGLAPAVAGPLVEVPGSGPSRRTVRSATPSCRLIGSCQRTRRPRALPGRRGRARTLTAVAILGNRAVRSRPVRHRSHRLRGRGAPAPACRPARTPPPNSAGASVRRIGGGSRVPRCGCAARVASG